MTLIFQVIVSTRMAHMTHALNNIYPLDEIKNTPENKPEPQPETQPETMTGALINWRVVDGKGRGVFAQRLIRAGEVIEIAPVVPMGKHNIPDDGGAPDGYVLEWREDVEGEEHALVLGYVMFYNHGSNPNIHLESDFDNDTVTVTAVRDIQKDEELIWDYNCEIWFDVAE